PGNRKARYGLAKTYFSRDQYGAAIVILEELSAEAEKNKQVWLLYAKALFREKSVEPAMEAYRQALAIDPDFTDDELDRALRHPQAGSTPGGEEDEIDDDALRILEKPDIDFSHVGGMANVKEEIELKIIHPLKHPDLYAAYGKKIGGGILLYGPPGCGKTHLARATAGQVKAKFISIGINDVLDMWIGNSEKNLHEIFEVARRNKPCVLFFDEVDALGASRSDMRQSAGRQLINQFLAELDGIDSDNDGLLILGATNAPWHLDPAFRRPGRFDRVIFVQPPDHAGREHILQLLVDGKPQDKLDLSALAKKTAEYSGADLKAVLDIAIEAKLRESVKTGIPGPLTTKDLQRGIKQHKPTTKEWFNTARNYALYANDSGLYDEILDYLKIKK
ncbi:MAG: AAA family ATPase, partial [Bacteroidota bacterium]